MEMRDKRRKSVRTVPDDEGQLAYLRYLCSYKHLNLPNVTLCVYEYESRVYKVYNSEQ